MATPAQLRAQALLEGRRGVSGGMLTTPVVTPSVVPSVAPTAPTGTVQGGGAINPIAVTKENNPEGQYLIIPASTRGEAKNPFIAPPEPYYGTEADLREMYDNTNELKDTFGSFDNYLSYSQEVQSNLENADWFIKEDDSWRPSSVEWGVLNGEDRGLSPNEREQAWSNINDRRKNAVKSNYQQWLMQEDTQGLLNKYGIDPVKYDDKGNVYTFTGNNYQMTVKADQPNFADYAKAVLQVAVSAALGYGLTAAFITPLAQSAGLTYGQTGRIIESLLGAGGSVSGAASSGALNEALDVLNSGNVIVNLDQAINQVDADVPEEIGQQQEEAAAETTPVVDIPFDIFIDSTRDEPIFANVETGDVTVGLPDILVEEEEGGGGAEATPVVTPTPEVAPEPTPTPVVTPAPVTPAPTQPTDTVTEVTPEVTPTPVETPTAQPSTPPPQPPQEVTQEEPQAGDAFFEVIDGIVYRRDYQTGDLVREINAPPYMQDVADGVYDDTGRPLEDTETPFIVDEEAPEPTVTPEPTQEPQEDTSSVVDVLLGDYINPVRDEITKQQEAINNLVDQVANLPVPPTTEEVANYLQENGVPLDEATLTNIQDRINEATANQVTQEQVDEAISGAGFATPDDIDVALSNAGFTTPEDVTNALAESGFATTEQLESAIGGLEFATPSDVINALAESGFATPADIATALTESGFASAEELADLASAFESSLTGLESAFGTSLEGIRGEFETGLEGIGEGLEGLGEGLEEGLSEAELGRRQLASRINQREFKPAPIPQLSYQPLQLEGLIQGPQRDYVNELNQIINRSLFEGMI